MLLPEMALPKPPKLSVKSGTGWNWKVMGLSLVSLTNLKDPQTDGGKSLQLHIFQGTQLGFGGRFCDIKKNTSFRTSAFSKETHHFMATIR